MTPSHTVLTALFLVSASVASAQTEGQIAKPMGGIAPALRAQTSAPIIRPCGPYPLGGSCFRISFRVSVLQPGAYKIGYINTPFMHDTVAYSATGAVCKAHPIGGMAYGGTPFGNVNPTSYIWHDEATLLTEEKPAILIAEFACDDRLVEGDSVTLQVSFAVDPGRRVEFVRYAVSEMKLRSRP